MTRKLTEMERLECQLIRGQYRVGPEAAREIARRVTDDHGFWDFEERRRAARRLMLVPVDVLPQGDEAVQEAA